MENGSGIGGGVGGVNPNISCDDVISKLKDEGDFDRLRLKIIRKLKENEELRNSIVSIVKQSVALNRPGAENLKPRQLSDAIHQEIGGKLKEQISDGLWGIIRSPDGMKSEIIETVRSVYDKLSGGKRDENGGGDQKRIRKEDNKANGEAAGFSQAVHLQETRNGAPMQPHTREGVLENDTSDPSSPPGFSSGVGVGVEHKEQGDGSDDDELDAPPGFG